MPDRLFVYGTLAPGRSNAHVLATVPGTWEPATVRGTLFPEGWGAALGYPGIVLSVEGGGFRASSSVRPSCRRTGRAWTSSREKATLENWGQMTIFRVISVQATQKSPLDCGLVVASWAWELRKVQWVVDGCLRRRIGAAWGLGSPSLSRRAPQCRPLASAMTRMGCGPCAARSTARRDSNALLRRTLPLA